MDMKTSFCPRHFFFLFSPIHAVTRDGCMGARGGMCLSNLTTYCLVSLSVVLSICQAHRSKKASFNSLIKATIEASSSASSSPSPLLYDK